MGYLSYVLPFFIKENYIGVTPLIINFPFYSAMFVFTSWLIGCFIFSCLDLIFFPVSPSTSPWPHSIQIFYFLFEQFCPLTGTHVGFLTSCAGFEPPGSELIPHRPETHQALYIPRDWKLDLFPVGTCTFRSNARFVLFLGSASSIVRIRT